MARSLFSLWNATARPKDLPADAELLTRFTAWGDHAAFELLVRRHAAAVWAATRGVLRNDADADDAAQATFLTLARHARSVKVGSNLGGWLHRVAVRAALKLRGKRRPTAPLPDVPVSNPTPDDSAVVLHEELAQLPANYREVLVTVDLEGHGHAEAARVLGWPVGTVSGRVVRARAELRRRLERRGVTAALVAATVGGNSIRAAVELAVGATVAPPEVISLSTEVWSMVATSPRKLAAVVMAGIFGLVVVGGVVAVAQGPKPVAPPKVGGQPAKPEAERKPVEKVEDLPAVELLDSDSAEVTLAKKMILLQLKRYALIQMRIESGQFNGGANYVQLCDTLNELTVAAEDAFPKPQDQLPWFELRHAEYVRFEKFNASRIKEGVEEPHVGPQLQAAVLKAELALVKVQKKAKK